VGNFPGHYVCKSIDSDEVIRLYDDDRVNQKPWGEHSAAISSASCRHLLSVLQNRLSRDIDCNWL
jgi:hypothetical protein